MTPITPTVGRIVLVRRSDYEGGVSDEVPAIVTAVLEDPNFLKVTTFPVDSSPYPMTPAYSAVPIPGLVTWRWMDHQLATANPPVAVPDVLSPPSTGIDISPAAGLPAPPLAPPEQVTESQPASDTVSGTGAGAPDDQAAPVGQDGVVQPDAGVAVDPMAGTDGDVAGTGDGSVSAGAVEQGSGAGDSAEGAGDTAGDGPAAPAEAQPAEPPAEPETAPAAPAEEPVVTPPAAPQS